MFRITYCKKEQKKFFILNLHEMHNKWEEVT